MTTYTPVLEFRGGSEWPGSPVASQAEAVEALRDMIKRATKHVIRARLDVVGTIVVPLKDLGAGK